MSSISVTVRTILRYNHNKLNQKENTALNELLELLANVAVFTHY